MNLSISSISSLLIPPIYSSKSIIYNNDIYLYGGEVNKLSNILYCYNIKNNTYNQINTINDITPLTGHSCNIYNNKIYIFGGDMLNQRSNLLYELDIDNLIWKKIDTYGEIPEPRLNHIANIINNTLYIFSGCDWNKPYYDLYSINLETFIWTKLLDTSICRIRSSSISHELSNSIYVYGGEDENTYLQNDIYQILLGNNPSIKKIECNGRIPKPSFGHTCLNYGENKMIIVGGYYGDMECSNFIYTLNLETKRFDKVQNHFTEMFTGREGHTSCISDNTLYVIGGRNIDMQVLGDVCKIELIECPISPELENTFWMCNTCTFSENDIEDSNCSMCGAENGINTNKSVWCCKVCTFENNGCDTICSVCDNLNQ